MFVRTKLPFANIEALSDGDVCLSVHLFVRQSPVKFVKSFAMWQHLAASGISRIVSDILVLPRDAMHSANYAVAKYPSVRPSVCLSVTCRYSIETPKHIIKLFSQSGSHTILVFPHQTVWQYSDRGYRMQGVGKNRDDASQWRNPPRRSNPRCDSRKSWQR